MVKVLCIDDSVERKPPIEGLKKKNKKLDIKFVVPETFFTHIEEYADIDLFITDHKLSEKKVEKNLFDYDGLTLGSIIRMKYGDIPIYLYSADMTPASSWLGRNIAYAKKIADDVFIYSTLIDKGHEILYQDAMDFKKISKSERGGLDSLISLLKPPDKEVKKIKQMISEDVKNYYNDKYSKKALISISYAKWVKSELLSLPGILYNKEYLSLKLGVKEKYLINILDFFAEAKYDGIFCSSTTPDLWWNVKIIDLITKKAGEIDIITKYDDIKDYVETIFSVQDKDILKCHICGEKHPESFGENDMREKFPVHIRCSHIHPTKNRRMEYDTIRYILV
jgi:hypothetical protein